MIDPFSATAIIIAFLVIWAIIIPVCGVIPKVKEIISYRYLVVTVFLACTIGVIVNFGELDTGVKMSVIVGTAILSGLYIVLRSIEKLAFNGLFSSHDLKASVSKGDIEAKIELKNGEKENGKN